MRVLGTLIQACEYVCVCVKDYTLYSQKARAVLVSEELSGYGKQHQPRQSSRMM